MELHPFRRKKAGVTKAYNRSKTVAKEKNPTETTPAPVAAARNIKNAAAPEPQHFFYSIF
jgi:hypothetical protein